MPGVLLAVGLALGLLVLHLASVGLVLVRLRGKDAGGRATGPATGPVTLLRPVRGLENHIEATLRSGLTLDDPDVRVLFCVEDGHDPVVPLVQRLLAQHPATDAQLLVGADRITANPKLNNLAKGMAATQTDWVVMADSNLLLPPDYIAQLQARWQPDTGLVTSPAVGVQPDGFAAALECGFLNTYQARWQLAADQVGLGFAQGKTLFWRRDVLEAGGGLVGLGAELAEDVAATKLVRRQGLQVRLTRAPFAQPIGARRFACVWARQVRWARIRRFGFPGLFFAEWLTGFGVPLVASLYAAVALGVAWPGVATLGLALGGLWYGAEWVLARQAGWPATPRDLAAWVVRDGLVPVLWLAAWAGRGFVWHGTVMAPAPRAVQSGRQNG